MITNFIMQSIQTEGIPREKHRHITIPTQRGTVSSRIRLHGLFPAPSANKNSAVNKVLPQPQNSQPQPKALASSLRLISSSSCRSLIRNTLNGGDTKISLDLGTSFNQNMRRIAISLNIHGPNAPKLISSLNRYSRPPLWIPTPITAVPSATPAEGPGHPPLVTKDPPSLPTTDTESHPVSSKKVFYPLTKRQLSRTDIHVGAVSPPDHTCHTRVPVTIVPVTVLTERKLSQTEHTDDDHILETFSRNAQYKTSKRRMTKMTKIPMIVRENSEDASETDEEESKKSHESGYSFEDKQLHENTSLQQAGVQQKRSSPGQKIGRASCRERV